MKRSKREGFTLVELLIVIVVIGILSAMMMLSSTEAVSSAKASNIVSNLRNWKTAALAYYVDNMDTADASNFDLTGKSADVGKYLNAQSAPGYNVQGKGTGTWYVTFEGYDANVAAKLNARRASVGIAGKAVSSDYGNKDNEITAGDKASVYMFVR